MIYLSDLLELQKEFDDFIIEQKNIKLSKDEILTDTLLALQIEVSELANATRVFKYWSIKAPEKSDVIIEEYVDVLFFWLSAGNKLGFRSKEIEDAFFKKRQKNIDRAKTDY